MEQSKDKISSMEDPQEGFVCYRRAIKTPMNAKKSLDKFAFMSPRCDGKPKLIKFADSLTVSMSHDKSLPLTTRTVAPSVQPAETPLLSAPSDFACITTQSVQTLEVVQQDLQTASPSHTIATSDTLRTVSFEEVVGCYTVKSRAGMLATKVEKTNQDAYVCIKNFACIKNAWLFGVFDGHGTNGHLASDYIKQFLPTNIELIGLANVDTVATGKTEEMSSEHFSSQPIMQFKGSADVRQRLAALISGNETVRHAIFKDAFLKTNEGVGQKSFSTNFSGSTAVTVFLMGRRLLCANAGDSRAIMGACKSPFPSSKTKLWRALPLSRDHKPDTDDEYKRIIQANGRVDPMRGPDGMPIGPARVWLKNGNVPGLAMSRSIGDKVASQVGVICEPEIFEKTLAEEDKFIVIASDGIWEFLSNDRVVDLVAPFWENNDPEGACQKLITLAVQYWECEDEVTDDPSWQSTILPLLQFSQLLPDLLSLCCSQSIQIASSSVLE